MSTFGKILLFYVIMNLTYVNSSRILAVFPFNGKSHTIMFNALAAGLAKRSHQVDVITHFPLNKPPPNYKVIVNLNGTLPPITSNYTVDFLTTADIPTVIAKKSGNQICELLGLEEIQKLIKNPPQNPPYDVVIVEAFSANCFMGLGHVFKVPVIAVSSCADFPWIADYTGNADNWAFVQSFFRESFDKTKFLDRFLNFISHHWHVFNFQRITEEIQTNLMRKYLRPDMPNIREVEKSLALILINRHPLVSGLRPVTPSLVEVSGLHLEENDPPKLSSKLQQWLDESDNGVVYFSFGSMVLIESLPTDILQTMYKSFAKIAPTKILMKVANETKLPPGLPKNVKLFSWVPQQAVLAHKNVRVFMTHGGLLGAQEALYHGVPMIGIPIFSDQPQNVKQFVALNIAVKINHDNITTSSLDEALKAVLYNPKYRDNMKRLSNLFKDRPIKAMDTAVYWIEYVIRNGNVLRSPALELTWWQLALLDVYGCLLIIFIIAFASIYYAMNYLARKVLFLLLQIFIVKQNRKLKKR